jgi:hypothetical protein
MDSGKRVWTWASAILALLCGALGIAHVLLTQGEMQPTGTGSEIVGIPSVYPLQSSAPPAADRGFGTIETAPVEVGSSVAARRDNRRPTSDSGSQISDSRSDSFPQTDTSGASANPPDGDFMKEARDAAVVQTIKPLGMVELAGGHVQAVIQDGEWTRLVEAGEVLSDNSRVLRVSADGVEILRATTPVAVEFARQGGAAPPPARAEMASAEREGLAAPGNPQVDVTRRPEVARGVTPGQGLEASLPGMETGEASYRLPPPLQDPEPLPSRDATQWTPSGPEPSAKLVSGTVLGRVEHWDGRIQSVLPDGPWVKLVPETAASAVHAVGTPSMTSVNEPNARTGMVEGQAFSPTVPAAGLPGATASMRVAPPLPNSIEAIGIVEWQNGHTLAVLVSESSVDLVDSSLALAAARKRLDALPEEGGGGNGRADLSAASLTRRDEDEMLALGLPSELSATRAPPEAEESPPPDELARGQPEQAMSADMSRAPPPLRAETDGLADLPGIDNPSAARIEPLGSMQYLADALRGTPRDDSARSVPRFRTELASESRSEANSGPDTDSDFEANEAVIGTVQWNDGSERLVISRGGSIQIVHRAEGAASASAATRLSAPDKGAMAGACIGRRLGDGKAGSAGLPGEPSIRDNECRRRQ